MSKKVSKEDVGFIQELVALGKTAEGQRTMQTDAGIVKKILDLSNAYGKQLLNKTIDKVRANYE